MNAIVVTNIGKDQLFHFFLMSVEPYLQKFGLALEVITSPRYCIQGTDGYSYLNFEKNQVYTLFDKYERILRLDVDLLLSPNCPNLFEIVPENKIGAVYEDVGIRLKTRTKDLEKAQLELGEIGWRHRYFNSGVVVASRCHRELFNLTNQDLESIPRWRYIRNLKEQTLLNYRVRQFGVEVHPLAFRFNHMGIFNGEWNGNPNYLDSWIIHLAGQENREGKASAIWERWKSRDWTVKPESRCNSSINASTLEK